MRDEDERQSAEDAGNHPDRGGEQEHLPYPEMKLHLAPVVQADQGGAMGDQHGFEKLDETF
ncbi:hypothetical protein D3C86_2065960 [compost metagenome]